jgi:hypothetical protein
MYLRYTILHVLFPNNVTYLKEVLGVNFGNCPKHDLFHPYQTLVGMLEAFFFFCYFSIMNKDYKLKVHHCHFPSNLGTL